MQGFKTILTGLAMVVIPPATQYLGTIDWNAILPGPWGVVIGGVIMIGLRFVTSTPVFNKQK